MEGEITFHIEGTIQPHGDKYVHIYVHGKKSKILRQYVGKKVKGIIVIVQEDDKDK